MKNIQKQLKNLRAIKFDENASKKTRAFLLSKIEDDIVFGNRVSKNPISLISIFTPSIRAIIVSLVVILLPSGGFTTVKAALSSLPGDLLYPIKITTEKIQVAFVSNEDSKTQLRVGFAERRLREAEEIINKEENGEKEEKINIAVEKFKEEILNITENLENLEDESQKIIIEDKIASLNNEAEKIAQVVDIKIDADITDEMAKATSIEIAIITDDILEDIIIMEQEKNPASATIMFADEFKISKPKIED